MSRSRADRIALVTGNLGVTDRVGSPEKDTTNLRYHDLSGDGSYESPEYMKVAFGDDEMALRNARDEGDDLLDRRMERSRELAQEEEDRLGDDSILRAFDKGTSRALGEAAVETSPETSTAPPSSEEPEEPLLEEAAAVATPPPPSSTESSGLAEEPPAVPSPPAEVFPSNEWLDLRNRLDEARRKRDELERAAGIVRIGEAFHQGLWGTGDSSASRSVSARGEQLVKDAEEDMAFETKRQDLDPTSRKSRIYQHIFKTQRWKDQIGEDPELEGIIDNMSAKELVELDRREPSELSTALQVQRLKSLEMKNKVAEAKLPGDLVRADYQKQSAEHQLRLLRIENDNLNAVIRQGGFELFGNGALVIPTGRGSFGAAVLRADEARKRIQDRAEDDVVKSMKEAGTDALQSMVMVSEAIGQDSPAARDALMDGNVEGFLTALGVGKAAANAVLQINDFANSSDLLAKIVTDYGLTQNQEIALAFFFSSINTIRHQLYGSALTDPEILSFNKAYNTGSVKGVVRSFSALSAVLSSKFVAKLGEAGFRANPELAREYAVSVGGESFIPFMERSRIPEGQRRVFFDIWNSTSPKHDHLPGSELAKRVPPSGRASSQSSQTSSTARTSTTRSTQAARPSSPSSESISYDQLKEGTRKILEGGGRLIRNQAGEIQAVAKEHLKAAEGLVKKGRARFVEVLNANR